MSPDALSEIESTPEQKQQKLLEFFKPIEQCIVAFSGGVDSAVVAKAAFLVLGKRSRAVMALSPSVATGEAGIARRVADEIGIELTCVETHETTDSRYIRNDSRRCYFCKQELYQRLLVIGRSHPDTLIVNGTNLDDLDDFRPGLEAASELKVASPLADCGLNKSDVRQLAKQWNLSVWDKPATPCLSSRIAYGESVTPEKLAMVDQAETLLKELGFVNLRVRYHAGHLARIEVPVEDLSRFLEVSNRHRLAYELSQLGFRFVTLDLKGFQSGSLNQLVQISSGQ